MQVISSWKTKILACNMTHSRFGPHELFNKNNFKLEHVTRGTVGHSYIYIYSITMVICLWKLQGQVKTLYSWKYINLALWCYTLEIVKDVSVLTLPHVKEALYDILGNTFAIRSLDLSLNEYIWYMLIKWLNKLSQSNLNIELLTWCEEDNLMGNSIVSILVNVYHKESSNIIIVKLDTLSTIFCNKVFQFLFFHHIVYYVSALPFKILMMLQFHCAFTNFYVLKSDSMNKKV